MSEAWDLAWGDGSFGAAAPTVCGTGGWTGPKPGDPDNNVLLSAVPAFGGIDVSWTYPSTNPWAVAHVLLYRAYSSNFIGAVQIAVVAGNRYYDPTVNATPVAQYYWIQVVTINGTVNDLVGPVVATARPRISELVEILSGQIEESALGVALRTEVQKITLTRAELVTEISNRIAGNTALMNVLSQLEQGVIASANLINSETIQRTAGQSALATQLNTQASLNASNAAAILTESTTRVTEDAALTANVVKAFSVSGANGAAIVGTDLTKVGYSGKPDNSFYDGNGSTVVYSAVTYSDALYPQYKADRTRIIDKLGVTLWNAMPGNVSNQLVWYAGLPLATAVKKVGIDDGTGVLQTIEQRATAQKLTNGVLESQYTVKIDSGGTVSGFGLASTAKDGAVTSKFIVNADSFSISRPLTFSQSSTPAATATGQTWFNTVDKKIYKATRTGTTGWVIYAPSSPFIVDTTSGEVIINDAIINKLTVDKLRDSTGGVLIQNGTIRIGAGIQDGATRNVHKGNWLVNSVYIVGDTVVHNGNTWACSLAHTATPGTIPPNDPATVNNYWKITALRGQGQVKSFAFFRGESATAPSGGTFDYPNPSTAGWSDGIPADNKLPLWMSSRMFTSDGLSPAQAAWTTPAKVGTPAAQVRLVFSVLGTNAEMGTTNETWHDVPGSLDVYMASQAGVNGDFSAGAITGKVKIKGEAGAPGAPSTVAGPRGISHTTGLTIYSTVGAAIAAGEVERVAGPSPVAGSSVTLVFTETASARGWSQTWLKQINGLWAGVQFYLDGNAVITGTLSAGVLIAGSIKTDRIEGNAITIPVVGTHGVFSGVASQVLSICTISVPMTSPGKVLVTYSGTHGYMAGIRTTSMALYTSIDGGVTNQQLYNAGINSGAYNVSPCFSSMHTIHSPGNVLYTVLWYGADSTVQIANGVLSAMGVKR